MATSKTILITGTSSGFGKLTAETLARKGHTVFATLRDIKGRNKEVAEGFRKLAKKEDLDLKVIELDVTSDVSVNEAVEFIMESAGRIDVVVNNAGIGGAGPTETFEVEQAQRMFDVNVFGVGRVNRAVLPHMRKQRSGLIVHVSSLLGRMTLPFLGFYAASKYALEALAESYRYELGALGIDAVVVEPGAFPTTGFLANAMRPGDTRTLQEYGPIQEVPAKMFERFFAAVGGPEGPDPQDVADAIAELTDTEPGKRPFRTVVDLNGDGVRHLNRASEELASGVLNGLDMKNLLTDAVNRLD